MRWLTFKRFSRGLTRNQFTLGSVNISQLAILPYCCCESPTKIERRIRTLIQPYYISSTFLALVQLHYMSLRDTKRLLIDA